MNPKRQFTCVLALSVLSAAVLLSACGGGGGADSTGSGGPIVGTPSPSPNPGPGDTPTPTPTPNPAPVAFAAFGTSADSVSLGWGKPAGSATYAIERKSAGGDWVAVASVDARSGVYLDSGLAALTDYSYRLVDVGATRTTLAESAAKTSDEQPEITAVGSALADAMSTTVGRAGGALASPDGAIVVNVPAGALAAETAASVQSVTNTAPDGRGHGLKVRINAAPSAALTLTLRYDAAEDAEADGQRIAVQRSDGSWLSLPLLAIDKTARTLTAELPPSLFAAPVTAAAAERTARAMAAGVTITWIEFTVDRYLGVYLLPKQARVAVKKSLQLTPFARARGVAEKCDFDAWGRPECIAQLVMPVREIQLLNSKAGYDRRWTVSGVDGGNSTVGNVAPSGSVGARFTAPASKPDPAMVTVSFHSTDVKTGRTVTLSSQVEITEDQWVGTMSAETPPSEAGTSMIAIAHAGWEINDVASTDTRKVYRASGEIGVVVADDDCKVSISPSNQPVATDAQLAELVVDETAQTYTLHLITFWPATLSARCPKGSATTATLAGYGWEVSGSLSAGGNRIEGKKADQNGAKVEWSFTRPTAGTR